MTQVGFKTHQVAKVYGITVRSPWRNLHWAADLETVRSGQ
jgi:hypothetical protein